MMGGIHMQKLTTNDALAYLKAVKDTFPDRRDIFDNFLDAMKDFKAQRIDTYGVIARVKELFKGHRDLILGFNAFLPKGYEINLPPENEALAGGKKHADFSEAVNFVNKIKARFQGDEKVYKSFLHILNMYKENQSIQEVHRGVAALFCDHDDLLVEFTDFLPDYSAEASLRNAQSARNSTLCRVGRVSPMSMERMSHVDKKTSLSHVHRYPTGDWPDRHPEKMLMRNDTQHRRHVKEENEIIHGRDGRRICHAGVASDDKLQLHLHKRECAKSEDLSDGQFFEGVHGQQLALSELCEKVKDRLENSDDYQEFMKCLHIHNKHQITDSQLRSLVFIILKDYPDLLEEFDKFKAHFDTPASLWTKRDISTLVKVEDKDRQLKMETREKNYDSREERYDPGLGFANKGDIGSRTALCSSKDKHFTKPIQELDLSNCEACTPSYRLLPKNYPIPLASQRTKMSSEVLNDHWVSVTSGSEDYSFKHMRRNQYEESLFRCEDDRFEMDMLLESVKATIRRVEELLGKTVNDSSPVCVDDHFTDLNLRCIERLYGEHGLDVLDVLRNNASVALPVILTRLKQKQEEWARCQYDFNKVWGEVYAKNYHKSLDHRSFYFKQQDRKSLTTKVLLAEIKEISDYKSKEDGMLMSLAAGNKHPIIPHLEFEYPDPDIHEDLYKLIKYSCGEVCTSEQVDKVMKIWTTFVEPMLGIPPRPPVSSRKGDESITHASLSENDVNVIKDGDSHFAGVEPKTDTLCNTPDNITVLNDSNIAVATCRGSKLATFTGLLSSSVTGPKKNLVVDIENISELHTSLRPCNANAEGGFTMRASNDQQAGENDDNARDEFEESAHRLSEDSEIAFEIDHVSGSESADGEGCPPDEPDDDGDEDAYGCNVESKCAPEGMADAQGDEGNKALLPCSEHFLQSAKPVTKWIPQSPDREHDSQIFYGNDSFYVLFRLHYLLYERILKAKLYSFADENKRRIADDNTSIDSYSRFMNALYNLLDGSSDNAKYEDDCRAIIGAQSYILFTLDKLIFKLVKQLQIIATDEMSTQLLQLHAYERSRKPGRLIDHCYGDNARVLLQDENIYHVECTPAPTRLIIQLMDYWFDKADATAVSMDPNFAAYVTDLLAEVPGRQETLGIFLRRNKRKYDHLDGTSAFIEASEGLLMSNGLEIKIASGSYRQSYVLGSEDFLIRRKRKILHQNGSSNGHVASSNGFSMKRLMFEQH